MSTRTAETSVRAPAELRSQESHKSRKRKHAGEDGEQSSKKKKHKKAPVENDISASEQELLVKKPKRKSQRAAIPPKPITLTSPSESNSPGSSPPTNDEPQPLTSGLETTPSPRLTPQPDQPNPLDDDSPSPFHSVRLSLYLPLSAISLNPSTALPSLLAEHLSPLLLTFFAPARGIVLAFSDPILSSRKPDPDSPPTQSSSQHLAKCADEYGTSYTWLTANFLVFRPQPAQELDGWINVASEGFIGLVSYNYFQTGVGKARIPKNWRWNAPGGDQEAASAANWKRKAAIVKLRAEDGDEDAMDIDQDMDEPTQPTLAESQQGPDWAEREDGDDGAGHFVRTGGSRVKGILQYTVLDAEVVPGHDRDKWSIQIEGTLLDPEAERALVDEERAKAERLKARGRQGGYMMSGGLGRASVAGTLVPGR